jgi:phosphoribosyl-dephospho-CoA transferase
MNIRRHDWVYLRARAQVRTNGDDAAVRRWIESGLPMVAARQPNEGSIALGVALRDGRRVACTVAPHDVLRHRNPLTVEEAAQVLDVEDAGALRRFADAMAGHALQLGVYGSTAWEFFAGPGYRHAQSDIDVICDVASSAGLTACLNAFCDGTHYFRAHLDGEIRVAGGHAIAWRELHEACAGGAEVVLAKDERDVALVTLHHVLASLR